MARVLIVYGTTEGHTEQIVDRMATAIRSEGHEVELHDAKEVRKQAVSGDFDGIIVGGSIHTGEYQSSIREFVKRNRDRLERTPSAFFSVSPQPQIRMKRRSPTLRLCWRSSTARPAGGHAELRRSLVHWSIRSTTSLSGT